MPACARSDTGSSTESATSLESTSCARQNAVRPIVTMPVMSDATRHSRGAIVPGYASAGKYWRQPPPVASLPSPHSRMRAVCEPAG